MVSQESGNLIRNYIINRQGKATKSEVVKYLQNEVPENLRLSRDTVLKVIDNMNNIVVMKGNRRGQGHKLLIEDKIEFDRIDEWLSKIEVIINAMQDPIEKIDLASSNGTKEHDSKYCVHLELDFLDEYGNAMHHMLEVLLYWVSNKIYSEKDAWSLYTRIIKLKVRVNEQVPFSNYRVLLGDAIRFVKELDRHMLYNVNIKGESIEKILTNFIEKIESFRNEFEPFDPDLRGYTTNDKFLKTLKSS